MRKCGTRICSIPSACCVHTGSWEGLGMARKEFAYNRFIRVASKLGLSQESEENAFDCKDDVDVRMTSGAVVAAPKLWGRERLCG